MSKENKGGLLLVLATIALAVGLRWYYPPGPPEPTPIDPPIPKAELARVMIVHETGPDAANAKQRVVLTLPVVEWLKKHCLTDTDFRLWDDDYTTEQLQWTPDSLVKLYNRAREDSHSALPWVVMADTNGNILTSQAFPTNTADQLALLKQYGGE